MPANVLVVDILFIVLVAIAGAMRWPDRARGKGARRRARATVEQGATPRGDRGPGLAKRAESC